MTLCRISPDAAPGGLVARLISPTTRWRSFLADSEHDVYDNAGYVVDSAVNEGGCHERST